MFRICESIDKDNVLAPNRNTVIGNLNWRSDDTEVIATIAVD